MKIGMVGLGKMGGNMTSRLLKGGHEVVVIDHNQDAISKAESEGADGAESLEDLVGKLKTPRIVWVMVPAGDPTESLLNELGELLSDGDTIIDGGNSNYKDTQRRATELKEKGISLVDVGTSGGVWGLAEGYSMMIGGEASKVKQLHSVFETLAPGENTGWGYVGSNGAGHFVKMVHNGNEYGLMQAYAEGFEIMKAKEEYDLDLHNVAEIWRYGSVVRSWLLDLTAEALKEDPDLSNVKDWVADSGEGRWTVAEAIDLDIPAPVITLSLMMRLVSRQDERYSAKLLAAIRNQFGGHAIKREGGS
jgi:6-phosphogluconate dehydrogenase